MHFVSPSLSYLNIGRRRRRKKKAVLEGKIQSVIETSTHMTREAWLRQPAGLNYLNRGSEGEGEDGGEEEAHELRS